MPPHRRSRPTGPSFFSALRLRLRPATFGLRPFSPRLPRSASRTLSAVLCLLSAVSLLPSASAQPLSRTLGINFFRDVPSRNLKGLATRADGRLVSGPILTDLNGPAFADILWCLEPAAGKWVIGTGPEGKIFEITLDAKTPDTFSARELIDLDATHIFALKRLPDGTLLAGTSPRGALYLIRDGKVAAQLTLPVDSIFDLQLLPGNKSALIATGNPGRIYKVDLTKFAAAAAESTAGVPASKSAAPAPVPALTDTKLLAEKGVTLLTEVSDRNIRRLALLGDRVVAGTSPKGNVYSVSLTDDSTPILLQENRDAEVAALLPQPNGDLYAAIVFSTAQAESRLNRPAPPRTADTPAAPAAPGSAPAGETTPAPPPANTPPPTPPAPDRFSGRSALVYFPRNGLPETTVGRNNLAFYTLARRGDTLLIAGGEQGDLLGYDFSSRLGLTFAGTASAQINQILPLASENSAPTAPHIPGSARVSRAASGVSPDASVSDSSAAPDRFLLLRNNTPGLAILDFTAAAPREAETKRLDLGSQGTLGALRVPRIRDLDPAQIAVEIRTSLASDEAEGWGPWIPAPLREDGWIAPDTRGRYVKLRLKLPAAARSAQLEKADLHHLPQNRRPQLTEFRNGPAGYALVPPAEPASFSPGPTSLSSLMSAAERSEDSPRRSNVNNATVFPSPNMQIVTWSLSDADGDDLRSTFSLRREGTDTWLDLALNTRDTFAQFDTTHLADGVYFTRVIATEQSPRSPQDRLTAIFDTDDLVIDKTAPAITEAKASRETDALVISVTGRDALGLLQGVEFIFNNGHRAEVTQPADAIRDSRVETFILRESPDKITGATSVEILLTDESGNTASRRLSL